METVHNGLVKFAGNIPFSPVVSLIPISQPSSCWLKKTRRLKTAKERASLSHIHDLQQTVKFLRKKFHGTHLKCKKTIYEAYYLLILTYSSETWTMRKKKEECRLRR